MTPAEMKELWRVWDELQGWSSAQRLSLAQLILGSLRTVVDPPPVPHSRPLSELIGSIAGSGPPPTDEEVKQWIDDYRMEKYGS